MGRTLKELATCFAFLKIPRTSTERPRLQQAVGEATLDVETATAPEDKVRPWPDASTSSMCTATASPFASPAGPITSSNGTPAVSPPGVLGRTVSAEPRQERKGTGVIAGRQSGAGVLGGGRTGSTSVRFADASPSSDSSRHVDGMAADGRPLRVRVLAASDASNAGADRQPGTAASNASVTSACSTGDKESRALAHLLSKLVAAEVNFRGELERMMDAFGPCFPRACLDTMLREQGVRLSGSRLAAIQALYRAPDDEDKIDGVALLKDLERAAFKRFATAGAAAGAGAVGGGGGGNRTAPTSMSGEVPPGAARKGSVASVQMSDRSRIISLVSTQLSQDKSLSMAGGDPLADVQHIQEAIQQIDLTDIVIPVGTRARYVPATDDPDSFRVPVWSLRAMQRRKRERDRFLRGSDSDFRKLGAAGREALRKRLTRRSVFQQQEIIASAVVAAARAAMEPAVRKAENLLQSSRPSRCNSFGLGIGTGLAASRSGSLHRAATREGLPALSPEQGGGSASPMWLRQRSGLGSASTTYSPFSAAAATAAASAAAAAAAGGAPPDSAAGSQRAARDGTLGGGGTALALGAGASGRPASPLGTPPLARRLEPELRRSQLAEGQGQAYPSPRAPPPPQQQEQEEAWRSPQAQGTQGAHPTRQGGEDWSGAQSRAGASPEAPAPSLATWPRAEAGLEAPDPLRGASTSGRLSGQLTTPPRPDPSEAGAETTARAEAPPAVGAEAVVTLSEVEALGPEHTSRVEAQAGSTRAGLRLRAAPADAAAALDHAATTADADKDKDVEEADGEDAGDGASDGAGSSLLRPASSLEPCDVGSAHSAAAWSSPVRGASGQAGAAALQPQSRPQTALAQRLPPPPTALQLPFAPRACSVSVGQRSPALGVDLALGGKTAPGAVPEVAPANRQPHDLLTGRAEPRGEETHLPGQCAAEGLPPRLRVSSSRPAGALPLSATAGT